MPEKEESEVEVREPKVDDIWMREHEGKPHYVRIARKNGEKSFSVKKREGKTGAWDHGSYIIPRAEMLEDWKFVKNLKKEPSIPEPKK